MATRVNISPREFFIFCSFDYRIRNLDLISEAMDATGLYMPEANKRLAVLGDAALGLAIAAAWYPTSKSRGAYSTHLQQQACDANLASVARDIGLARHLALHPGHIGPVSTKILATGMEAIFGAIYEDCGGDMSIVTAAMTAVGIDVAMIDDY